MDAALPAADAIEARVLVVGDAHGDKSALRDVIATAARLECAAIVQLGDFGFWPHTPKGRFFVESINQSCAEVGVPLVWIDGNHENHTALRARAPRADGFVKIASHVVHAPRGHRWTWADTRFGALGGAFSIDWRGRTPGETWWAEETIHSEDVERLGKAPLDVLLTHDTASSVPIHGEALNYDDELRSYTNRRQVADAVANTAPRLLLHGHWHHRYGYTLNDGTPVTANSRETRVEGLSSNIEHREGQPGWWGVLHLPSLKFTDNGVYGFRVLPYSKAWDPGQRPTPIVGQRTG